MALALSFLATTRFHRLYHYTSFWAFCGFREQVSCIRPKGSMANGGCQLRRMRLRAVRRDTESYEWMSFDLAYQFSSVQPRKDFAATLHISLSHRILWTEHASPCPPGPKRADPHGASFAMLPIAASGGERENTASSPATAPLS